MLGIRDVLVTIPLAEFISGLIQWKDLDMSRMSLTVESLLVAISTCTTVS